MPKKTEAVYSLASTPETPVLLASCTHSLQTLFEQVWFAEFKKEWTSSAAQRTKLADMMKKTKGMYVPVPKKKIAEWSPAVVLHFLCAPALASFVGKQLRSQIVYANNDFLKLSAEDGPHVEILQKKTEQGGKFNLARAMIPHELKKALLDTCNGLVEAGIMPKEMLQEFQGACKKCPDETFYALKTLRKINCMLSKPGVQAGLGDPNKALLGSLIEHCKTAINRATKHLVGYNTQHPHPVHTPSHQKGPSPTQTRYKTYLETLDSGGGGLRASVLSLRKTIDLEATHKVKGNIYVVPDALSNTTSTRNAYGIAHFIAQKLKSQGMDAKASTITDACAGIGMTAIAFTHFFQKVHVVESNKNTLKWCKANLEMRGVSDRYAMWDTVHDYVSGCAAHHQTVVYLDGEGRKTSYCPYLTTKNGASGPADTTVLDVCSKIGPNATLIVLRMPATFKFNTVVQWCANSNNRFHHPQRSAPIPDDLDAEHKFYLVAIWTGDCKKMTNATPAINMSFVKSTAPKHATGATHATPPKHATPGAVANKHIKHTDPHGSTTPHPRAPAFTTLEHLAQHNTAQHNNKGRKHGKSTWQGASSALDVDFGSDNGDRHSAKAGACKLVESIAASTSTEIPATISINLAHRPTSQHQASGGPDRRMTPVPKFENAGIRLKNRNEIKAEKTRAAEHNANMARISLELTKSEGEKPRTQPPESQTPSKKLPVQQKAGDLAAASPVGVRTSGRGIDKKQRNSLLSTVSRNASNDKSKNTLTEKRETQTKGELQLKTKDSQAGSDSTGIDVEPAGRDKLSIAEFRTGSLSTLAAAHARGSGVGIRRTSQDTNKQVGSSSDITMSKKDLRNRGVREREDRRSLHKEKRFTWAPVDLKDIMSQAEQISRGIDRSPAARNTWSTGDFTEGTLYDYAAKHHLTELQQSEQMNNRLLQNPMSLEGHSPPARDTQSTAMVLYSQPISPRLARGQPKGLKNKGVRSSRPDLNAAAVPRSSRPDLNAAAVPDNYSRDCGEYASGCFGQSRTRRHYTSPYRDNTTNIFHRASMNDLSASHLHQLNVPGSNIQLAAVRQARTDNSATIGPRSSRPLTLTTTSHNDMTPGTLGFVANFLDTQAAWDRVAAEYAPASTTSASLSPIYPAVSPTHGDKQSPRGERMRSISPSWSPQSPSPDYTRAGTPVHTPSSPTQSPPDYTGGRTPGYTPPGTPVFTPEGTPVYTPSPLSHDPRLSHFQNVPLGSLLAAHRERPRDGDVTLQPDPKRSTHRTNVMQTNHYDQCTDTVHHAMRVDTS